MRDGMADGEPSAGGRDESALDGLVAKYARILALREAHDRARQGGAPEPDPRSAMADLAARWPGALRELDELPLDEVRARLGALREARAGVGPVLPWMHAQWVFHAEARGALAAKRWLRGRRDVDAALREAFLATADAEARGWSDELDRVARPPGGRVLALVWPRVAGALGVGEETARELVLGGARG